MRGFTLLELLVVLFIATTVAFLAFPSLWGALAKDDNMAVASALKELREEAIATKKETLFTADFSKRQFRITGPRETDKDKPRVLKMKDDETWQVFLPSRGTISEGEAIIAFTPSVQEEFIALYLEKNGKDTTVILDNLSGEVQVEDGKKTFDE